MNILAKIWSAVVALLGVTAIVGSLSSEIVDGYGVAGGMIFLITAVVAIVYIVKDDVVQKERKRADEEDRIATMITQRMRGGR